MDYKELANSVKLCGNSPKIDQCKKCNYWVGGDMRRCILKMTDDAAKAITELLSRAEAAEAESARLRTEVERWKSAHHQAAINFQQENRECNKAMHDLKAAEERAEKAERERDAAIERIREDHWCEDCKFQPTFSLCKNDGNCEECETPCFCERCKDGSLWKWRGKEE